MITQRLHSLPSRPGVYLFLDRHKRVVYVGKAKNLRNRVQSYFSEKADLGPRKARMVREVADLDCIATDSELEAFILEATLIKRHKPRYNIVLRDDKNYPYLCLTLKDPWPTIKVVRRLPRDGSACFGPYVPASAMWETLAFIRRTFPIRTCSGNPSRRRPCVEFQMHRCLGPCTGQVTRETYMKAVDEVKQFLRGQRRELLRSLENRMNEAATRLEYEEAAAIRDRIARIERALEAQKVISPGLGDIDVFGYSRDDERACVKVLFIRSGMLTGAKDFLFRNLKEESDQDILANAVTQFYTGRVGSPGEILIPFGHESMDMLSKWLSERTGQPVRIRQAPRSGKRRELLDMAVDNARMAMVPADSPRMERWSHVLLTLLGLRHPPRRIDCFDISTLAGQATVGCRVSWVDGQFDRDSYLRFHIRSAQGPDDFAAMREVIQRCYRKNPLPDLILVDGGRGQLEAATSALPLYWRDVTRLIAMAKMRDDRPERLFLPGRAQSVPLDPADPSTRLLQNIRDETHRFAITFHRKVRDRAGLASRLEQVRGIGKARRLALLKAFGSVENIRNARLEDLLTAGRMDRATAERLSAALAPSEEGGGSEAD